MIFVYVAAIVFVAFCIVMYFVLVAKKHEERLTKFKNTKNLKAVSLDENQETAMDEAQKEEIVGEMQDYVIETTESHKSTEELNENLDISQIDFEALENMSDEDFDKALNSYSPELRDAVLDELLRRNDDEG